MNAGKEDVESVISRLSSGTGPHRRVWLWAVALLAIAAVLYNPAADAWFGGRLLLAVRALAAGADGRGLGIVEEKTTCRDGTRQLEAIVYRKPKSRSVCGIVLVPGISELGCYHPRLQALSRHLAAAGFLVVTPDIREFREFRMPPQAMDQIEFWFRQVPTLDRNVVKTGLAGISFSATLSAITATRPRIRGQVAFIFGIGAYDDPLRCSRYWFASGPVTVGPGYYPTRFYAKWIIMLAALDLLPDERERFFLSSVLTNLLLQKPVPEAGTWLSPLGSRWYRLALMREDQADPELARQIEGRLTSELYAAITPANAAAEVRCPVFLVHGAFDDLIPPDESTRLSWRFVNAHTRVLISPFLTHTHPMQKEPGRWEKVRAVLEAAHFLYDFAGVARQPR
ncbi:MAG: alpha/beta hydrolase [Acidobacteria bacterium]|nr:alpha/beta hydrolase [Acidobacteriota bacterium]